MYRSPRRYQPAADRHDVLETVESTIQKHLIKSPPEANVLEIPYAIRKRHVYVVGKTQHGKSTLLHSMILQDIENGAGVCVLDPKGSGENPGLVESILQHIPPHRKDDVIYFSAAEPVPIDVMSWENEQERQTLAADLMQTFIQFSTTEAGDRWRNVLRHLVHTLLEAKDCTFLDINNFLVDEEVKAKILGRVKRKALLDFWNISFKKMPQDASIPIVTRMGTFVLVPPLSIMLGTAKPKLRIEDVIRQRKILLVDLTGAGKESGNLIGTLLVSKIQQAVFRGLRTPFHLFADEFQNFQTSAFDTILSEAGGLGLRLTLANQYVDQLEARIRSSVFGNVSTFFVFNVDDADTSYFKSKIPPGYLHQQLATLPPFLALYHIAGQDPIFKSIPLPPPPPTEEQLKNAEEVRKRTIRDYACKADSPLHNAGNGKAHEKPEPESTLPHDAGQAPGAPAPQRDVRPNDKRPRRDPTRPQAN